MLTWEGQQFQGAESIVEKIGVRDSLLCFELTDSLLVAAFPNSQAQCLDNRCPAIVPVGCQSYRNCIRVPSGAIVNSFMPNTSQHVIQVDDSPNPLPFAQTFQLIPDGGSYWV